jgi:hypothetical protein
MDNQFIAELAEKFIGLHISESKISESFKSKFAKDFELLTMMHPEVDIMDELSYNMRYVRTLESILSDVNKEELKTEEPKKNDFILTGKGIEDLTELVNKNIKNEEDLVRLYQTTDVIESINSKINELGFPLVSESLLRNDFNIKENQTLYKFLKSFEIKPKKYRIYTNESKTIKDFLSKSKTIRILNEGLDKKENYGFVDFESYTTDLDPIYQRMNPKEIDEDIIDDYEETPITTNKIKEENTDEWLTMDDLKPYLSKGKYLYHYTLTYNVDDILHDGLIPNKNGSYNNGSKAVFLTPSLDDYKVNLSADISDTLGEYRENNDGDSPIIILATAEAATAQRFIIEYIYFVC